ncbi:hypothetical protein SAMN05444695_109179 [Rhodococcus triatomae]|uniref:Uncharacterized protein n=1 Tax=Rhodococcus triatomae TaxID=300028 RepID=A0A1G8MCS4_9NOCA|nr:hypothetical protein [Rhodococcus triatomae]SDI65736.1 hypothetical protein SAMN05444695_109179 [Rhodococcus triatomae]
MTEAEADDVFGTERRDRMAAEVRRRCVSARVDEPVVDLSAPTALLLAAGHLDGDLRRAVVCRLKAGREFPAPGSYGDLRRLRDEHELLTARIADLRAGPVYLLVRHRLAEVGRRLAAWRSEVVGPGRSYSTGVRAVRRDRRDGVHLDPAQRELLFEALARTPAPVTGTAFDRLGATVRSVTAERLGQAGAGSPVSTMLDRVAAAVGGDSSGQSFTDGYDTLLYLAGRGYERIEGSSAWRSEHFAVQRYQVDLADELVQIATDTADLRVIRDELSVLSGLARTDAARAQVRAREAALDPVWDQLVERVAGLARIGDLLERADLHLRSARAIDRTVSLDSRIDDLIARSGSRELSTDNLHHVGDQIGDVDALVLDYRATLHRELSELTSGR